jgi:cyclase
MFRPRIIPSLLLYNLGLVKSVKFKNYRYIGDPINAVKIFNDLRADELAFLDIKASKDGKCISTDFVRRVGREANMPFSVGGGISSIESIREILSCGAEKVVLNSIALSNPSFIKKASAEFGSSTIVVSVDIKRSLFSGYKVYSLAGTKKSTFNALDFCLLMQEMGAGELIINSIDNDGTMEGYDINILKQITEATEVPIVALGGAGNLNDFTKAIYEGGASAVSAGSLFVYHGPRKAVLINYPTKEEKLILFKSESII